MLRINGLTMTDIVNPPAGTVAPVIYPVAVPTAIKAGYKVTFSLKTNGGGIAYIRVYANGQRLTVYTDSGTVDQIAVPTIRKNEVSTFSFWVYKDTTRNSVLDTKIELDKTKNDSSTKSIVDIVLGYHFGNIVGSSKEDSNINLTN